PMKPDPFYATDLRTDLPTLAERLQQAGYQTASFSGNRLIGPNFNMVRGFETAEFLDDDSKVIRRAQEYLEQKGSKPLFLFINLMSAHTPWFRNPIDWVMQHAESLTPETAPDWVRPHLLPKGIGLHPFHPYMKESLVFHYISGKKDIPESGFTLIRDLYDGELRRSDEHLGMLLSSWPDQNSVVAVTSDHGEYLGEHRLLEHGRTLYPEVLHVPLAIKAPNLPSKRVIDAPVPMHWLHDEILMQAGIPAENSLFKPPTAVYAAAYIDDYWAKHLGHPFDKGYRLKRENEVIHLMDSQYTCTRYILKERYLLDPSSDNCTDSTKEELAKLFSQSQSGATVQPDIETLEMLKKLGYVGENE
ncbi:MAG: sulfatase-like hydrolase/transferase, partial [Myxococcota bacterium]|nr:sulfatase-like hydrolase/transferase [Myxococcota bacterium]